MVACLSSLWTGAHGQPSSLSVPLSAHDKWPLAHWSKWKNSHFKVIWNKVPWLSLQQSSPWRGLQGNGICHCLSALTCLLNQILIMRTHAPLEASICKFYKEIQSCVLHRLAYLPTGFEQDWFRSKLKALPVPINHLSSRSVFAAATTYTTWAPIHCFAPPEIAPESLVLIFYPR